VSLHSHTTEQTGLTVSSMSFRFSIVDQLPVPWVTCAVGKIFPNHTLWCAG
jgi:hypothetical protein